MPDASGVDVDAACQLGDPTKLTNAGENYIRSPYPGASGGREQDGGGCDGFSTYDASTETTDFSLVDFETIALANLPHSDVKMRALFHVDGRIPPAGDPLLSLADLPDPSFMAFSYRIMFQNTTRQTNLPYIAGTRVGTNSPIYGLNEHHGDGFHMFVAFEAVWLGDHWMHSASVGIFDPGPDGAFFFDELGVSHSAGSWSTDDPCMPHGATWNVTYPTTNTVYVEVDGVTRFSNVQAVGNCIRDEYVKAGDNIVNIKGLSTADSTVTLPVTIPLSIIPGFSDITTVGGFLFTSDYTLGNSRNVGLVGIALQPNRTGLPFSSGSVGLVDTLGDGPRCWTPTFGGLVQPNPLHVSDQPCYIDDDTIPNPSGGNTDPGLGRGSIFEEWWDTPFSMTA